MEYPFEFIQSAITKRDEFNLTEGNHPTDALFFMKSGSFALDIDGQRVIVRDGDCVIFPDHIKFSRYVIEPIVFIYIKFRLNARSPLTFNLPYGKINISDKERFLSSISIYDNIIDRTDSAAMLYKKHLLFDMLLQISNEHGLMENKEDVKFILDNCRDKTVLSASRFIRESLSRKIKISDICRAAETNASTLNFKFRRELSMSVGEYIIAEKMKLAKKLLSGTTYSITDIAERCGYDNVYYFSTAFKKETGEPPQSYRKQFRV